MTMTTMMMMRRMTMMMMMMKIIWKKRANTVPIVIGMLGAISKNHLMYLGELECNISFETIQKTALLGTAQLVSSEELCIDWPLRPLISR